MTTSRFKQIPYSATHMCAAHTWRTMCGEQCMSIFGKQCVEHILGEQCVELILGDQFMLQILGEKCELHIFGKEFVLHIP